MIDYSLILTTNFLGKLWTLENNSYDGLIWLDASPKPTQAELDALWIPTEEIVAKADCKKKASELLSATDWTTIPDVASPTNSPYLTNQSDFIAYRNEIRKLAVTPVIDPVWAIQPTPIWG